MNNYEIKFKTQLTLNQINQLEADFYCRGIDVWKLNSFNAGIVTLLSIEQVQKIIVNLNNVQIEIIKL